MELSLKNVKIIYVRLFSELNELMEMEVDLKKKKIYCRQNFDVVYL